MNWTMQAPYIEVTAQCNLSCKHCYNKASPYRPEYITREIILKCLDFFAENNVSTVSISGGEPFLHPNIKQVLIDAYDRKLKTLVATNGTLLTNRVINEIKEYVDYFQISIDGSPEKHDLLRGAGSYEAAIQGVRLLCAQGLQKRTRFRMTISNKNIDSIVYVVEKAVQLGLEAVQFSTIRKQGRAEKYYEDNFQMNSEQLLFAYNLVCKLKQEYQGIIDIGRLTVDGGECTLLRDDIVLRPRIDSKGDIYPCEGFLDPDYKLGSVSEDLCEVFSDDRVSTCRSRLMQIQSRASVCKRCFWKNFICFGGCPAEALIANNQNGTDGLCEIRESIWRNRIRSRLENHE